MMRPLVAALVALLGAAGVIDCLDRADDCEVLLNCAPSDAAPCGGTCVPGPGSYFGGPYRVWLGTMQPPGDLCQPPLKDFFDGTAAPAPKVCPKCKCLPSTGSCSLPATVDANDESCPGAGSSIVFQPPNGWDGGCTNLPGGGSSARSVTSAPLVKQDGCTPTKIPVTMGSDPQPPAYAHACQGTIGQCANDGELCERPLSAGPFDPSGFWTYCITLEDPTRVDSCPTTYPTRHDFGDGWSGRQHCTPCTCGKPVGSSCTPSLVTIYADGACSQELAAVQALSSTPMCVDVNGASPLGSMSATPSVYTPGTCASSGGDVTGDPPMPAKSMTFCCQE